MQSAVFLIGVVQNVFAIALSRKRKTLRNGGVL